jgi:autotransporter-associated beta strand protein
VDLISVLAHEIGHGLGFTSFANQSSTVGAEGQFTEWNRNMVRGSTNPSAMFVTDKTQVNFGTFIGPVDTFTNGNDSNTGLFFNGSYSREVFAGGGPVPLFAPSSFQPGSSLSHVNDSTALMNPSVSTGVTRRFLAYEIAMMMDLGWNTYNWNGTKSSAANTGNWSEGISTLSDSRWTTEKGITFNSGGAYNVNSNQREAPILPVYGQVTANIALNFTNSGTTSYTSTNDIGTVRLARLNLNSTSTGTTTIAGGTLNFGLNANGSASVLVPKIVQSGSGAVTISSAIQTNAIATQTVDGVSFTGHDRVTIEGTGAGQVSLTGNITGTGGLTKNSSSFNLVLSGTNSYTGTTVVNGGTVFVNGNSSGATGAVTVNTGATLSGNGTVGGAVTINTGGTIEGGSATGTIGTLDLNNNLTVGNGGTLRAQLNGATSDRINLSGGSGILSLANGSIVALSATSFSTSTTYTLADLSGAGTSLLVVNGSGVVADSTISTFTFTSPTAGSSTGPVAITASGFSLSAGDKLLLRRDASGDLVLVFTPVPEPGGILVVCGLVVSGGLAWRRWRKRPGDHRELTPVGEPAVPVAG